MGGLVSMVYDPTRIPVWYEELCVKFEGDEASVLAEMQANPELIDLGARSQPDGDTPVHIAAEMNHAKALRLLLGEPGCCIDSTDAHGNTALHLAAANGALDAIEVLLDAGAEAGARNSLGYTAAEMAYDEPSRECLKSRNAFTTRNPL